MICVSDLLELPELSKAKLLCGEGGLYRKVSWPNIAQTPSISEWLVGGDVVIMTGVGLEITTEFLINILKECAEADAACIVVLIHEDHIKSIPDDVIECAINLQFPIIEAPWETRLAVFFRELFQVIDNDTQEQNLKNIFLEKIKAGDAILENGSIHQMLSKYGLTNLYVSIVINVKARKDKKLSVDNLRRITGLIKKKYVGAMHVVSNGEIVVFIPGDEIEIIKFETEELVSDLNEKYPDLEVRVGIGKSFEGLSGYARTYKSACKALMASKNRKIVDYSELGIYRLLMELPDDCETQKYMNEQIGMLLEAENGEDLLKTLMIYLQNDKNSQKTADDLYIHRNTLAKRLEKIESILEMSLGDASKVNDIFNAMLIYEYIIKKDE